MNRHILTIAAGILAAAAGGGAADAAVLYSTVLPGDIGQVVDSSVAPDRGFCDASRCGWTVYDVFTLAKAATIADLGVYSYISNSAQFAGASWSIWGTNAKGASVVPGEELASGYASGSPTVARGASAALLANSPVAGASLVTVNGLRQHLGPGTYYLGFQIDLNAGSSTYATTGGSPTVYFGVDAPTYNMPYYSQLAFYVLGSASGQGNAASQGGVRPVLAAPEPSTWAMLAIGFAGLALAARRRLIRPKAA